MITAAISLSLHDSSLCILEDEKVLLYVQEERMSRIKRDSSQPYKFLELIKNYTTKIDNFLVVNFLGYEKKTNDLVPIGTDLIFHYLKKSGIDIVTFDHDNAQHHLYHAASAFYGSGYDDAICLVIDGWGAQFELSQYLTALDDEDEIGTLGSETTSIYYFTYPCEVELLYKNLYVNPVANSSVNYKQNEEHPMEISTGYDIGVMYGTVTDHLGFDREDSGKVMGLSSYGKPNLEIPELSFKDTNYSDRNLFLSNRKLNTKLFPEILYQEDDFQKKSDIAYKIQKHLEKVFIRRVKQALELKPDCKNLVFSGGCALNILGNSLIKKEFPDINFFVDPVANDSCQAYGAVKYYYYDLTNSTKKEPLTTLYHGPKYNKEYLKNLVRLEVLKYNSLK